MIRLVYGVVIAFVTVFVLVLAVAAAFGGGIASTELLFIVVIAIATGVFGSRRLTRAN